MPFFAYKARSRTGEKVEGQVEAADRRGALLAIQRLGYVPVSVTQGQAKGVVGKGRRFQLTLTRADRMGVREVLTFTTELSDLLASGMTLGAALNALAGRGQNSARERVTADLRDRIIQGASLSDALAEHPKTFGDLYVNMIRAGEASGALADVLHRLVEHYEKAQDLKERIVMALVYPIIVLVMGAGTLVFSMVNVVPKFEKIFNDMGATLPLPTQILINTSGWLAKYGLFVAIAGVMLSVLFGRFINTPKGRRWWDGLKLKMPLIKGIVACGTYANFARTLETLLSNGVAVLQALTITGQTVGNAVIADELNKARERVTDGTTISGPLASGKVFPVMMTDMLAIGERTGDMPRALSHIGRRYETELDRNIKIFTTALEPILIVLVAVVVGFVAVSILMAVFNITNGLGV